MTTTRPKPTYWADLETRIPWRYRTRTRLTDTYVLQIAGWEADQRHHRLTLYYVTPSGRMRRVLTRRFFRNHFTDMTSTRSLALEILADELEDRAKKRGRPLRDQTELEASVRELRDEIARAMRGTT